MCYGAGTKSQTATKKCLFLTSQSSFTCYAVNIFWQRKSHLKLPVNLRGQFWYLICKMERVALSTHLEPALSFNTEYFRIKGGCFDRVNVTCKKNCNNNSYYYFWSTSKTCNSPVDRWTSERTPEGDDTSTEVRNNEKKLQKRSFGWTSLTVAVETIREFGRVCCKWVCSLNSQSTGTDA